MSVTVNINNLSLCHKGSSGISNASLPDVCKTPSPGGPIPLPYPNISMSSDLENGTSTVTADGGNMIAIKGSDFSRSTGDEPGTAGGIKSSVNMRESKWILYSFDVKIEGANACRLTDKKTQNGENTVDAQGEIQAPLPRDVLQQIACKCNIIPMEDNDTCRSLGEKKHACCDEEIKRHQPPPELGGEKGYTKAGEELTQTREELKAAGQLEKGMCFPDACAVSGGKPTQFFDFKFPCGGESDTNFYFPKGRSQYDKYLKLSQKLGITAPPVPITSRSC
jgi:hypothetical protein